MVKQYRAYIIVGLLVFFLDQLAKYLVRAGHIITSGHFLDVTFTTNVGSLFSLFDNVTAINIVFIIIGFLAIGFLIYYVETEKEFPLGVGLLLGGILGNLVDRIAFGAVIDWINFHFWPIFNIADAGIVCGIALLIISVLGKEKGARKK